MMTSDMIARKPLMRVITFSGGSTTRNVRDIVPSAAHVYVFSRDQQWSNYEGIQADKLDPLTLEPVGTAPTLP